mmetsp:Transcript_10539/g.18561  ORF Transcript_10539/g.18561 Transcript_10539/m.18561 type:complete len:237 (+) Transcript_10539:95-805(+)
MQRSEYRPGYWWPEVLSLAHHLCTSFSKSSTSRSSSPGACFILPISIGDNSVWSTHFSMFRKGPKSSVFDNASAGASTLIGIPICLSTGAVVPPNKIKNTQMTRKVAVCKARRVPSPSTTSTHLPSSKERARAMAPRNPACHIINMWSCPSKFHPSRGIPFVVPTISLMKFTKNPTGNVDAKRPTKQKSITHNPKYQPFDVNCTTDRPTRRKTQASASMATCCRKNVAKSEPSAER